jgi:hypothetical protein
MERQRIGFGLNAEDALAEMERRWKEDGLSMNLS